MSQIPSIEITTPVLNESCIVEDAVGDVAPLIVPERFVIDDAQKASWAVRKILEARAYAERVGKWAEQELRRADHEEQWLLRRFSTELEGWLGHELQRRGGRRRSVNLPGGTIGMRVQPQRLEILDEAETFAWSLAHLNDALRIGVDISGAASLRLLDYVQRETPEARIRRAVLKEPPAMSTKPGNYRPAHACSQPRIVFT